MAAALARIPDAPSTPARDTGNGSNGSGSNGNGSNGNGNGTGNGSNGNPTGRVVVPPATRPRRSRPVEPVVDRDVDPDVEAVSPTETDELLDTDQLHDTDAVDTELVPVTDVLDTDVDDTVDEEVETEVLPVVEPVALDPGTIEPEIADPDVGEPRIYDVEADEPGAYVALVPAVPEPAPAPALVEPEPEPAPLVVRRRRRPRVRRVTRVIRHVDTWTVFKVVLLFNVVLYATALISGVMLWNVAHGTGTVDNVERFMESFGWETFQFDGQAIFDNGWRIGLFLALGLTGLAVLAATTFNLITDIVGGIRVTVLEEEVVVAAPPMPRRTES